MSQPNTQSITSVGIDIGTTTTQLIISRLTIENTASGTSVPRMEITGKEVIHRSEIYFTPLLDHQLVNSVAVADLVKKEYAAAGLTAGEIDTGAVIITGETAKKENAKAILDALAGLAGDFVVATAGPNLESIYAGKGSGAAAYSAQRHKTIANVDVGGGTSNYAVFAEGRAIATACLNVGGHLIEFEPRGDRITYLAEPARKVLKACGFNWQVGDRVSLSELRTVVDVMAACVVEILKQGELSPLTRELLMTAPLNCGPALTKIMISGGVADYVYQAYKPQTMADVTMYGDYGPLLGLALREKAEAAGYILESPLETVRATVIGTGTQSVNLSGSTIHVREDTLPLRNVVVLSPFTEMPDSPGGIAQAIRREILRFEADDTGAYLALSLKGPRTMAFADIEVLAEGILEGMREYLGGGRPLILIIEDDCGKVLGQCLEAKARNSLEVLCIDQIAVGECDYIDIGKPLMGGRVVPVVLKTLVFNNALG